MERKALILLSIVFIVSLALTLIIVLSREKNQILITDSSILINADGSITPETASMIFDGEKYVLTADLSSSINVEKGDIIIDGAGHTVKGNSEEHGVFLNDVENVTITNLNVRDFTYGIHLYSVEKSILTNCTTTENDLDGIKLEYSNGNLIIKNSITHNGDDGLQLFNSDDNTVAGNYIFNNDIGVQVNGDYKKSASQNNIEGNNIEKHNKGIALYEGSWNTKIIYNNIKGCYDKPNSNGFYSSLFYGRGLDLWHSGGNVVHHNNFIQNDHEVLISNEIGEDFFDDGAKGNYWSGYTGADADVDGIGDAPYERYNYYESKMIEFEYPLMSQVNIDAWILSHQKLG